MRKSISALMMLALLLSGSAVNAQEGVQKASLRVLPWNGYKSAVSLTFDDADRSQVQTAVPALNERGLKATFFLIYGNNDDRKFWTGVAHSGHEIGNHSIGHLHPAKFSDAQVYDETLAAQKKLAQAFNTTILSYAYPYVEITKAMKTKLADTHVAARGGNGNYYMKPTSTPDWLNIPAQMTMTDYPLDTYKGWIDKALKQGAWTVFLIHGIEGTDWGYQPVPKQTFLGTLDHLQNPDIWVAPFGTVSEYWRAQKIVETALESSTQQGVTYRWEVPSFFPRGTVLRVTVGDGPKCELLQAGAVVIPDTSGVHTVSFDVGSLDIRPIE